MRCLLVEDEPGRVEMTLPELRKRLSNCIIDVVRDRDAAFQALGTSGYDLILLDQRIPSAIGQLDANTLHGRAVLDRVRDVAPDTPVYFLTGLPMEEQYLADLIATSEKRDLWGDGLPIALTRRFQKNDMSPLYDAVERIASTARVTEAIEVSTRGTNIGLSELETRLIQVLARRHDCIGADVRTLGGGLSKSRTFRVEFLDTNGNTHLSTVVKLGSHEAVAGEIESFGRQVSRLPAATYAPMIPGTVPRILNQSAVSYRLLEGYTSSLFDVLRRPSGAVAAAACIKLVQESQTPWMKGARVRKVRVREIVETLIAGEDLAKVHTALGDIAYQRFEEREIRVRSCIRHGDLHGENILVDAENRPMLIDYGSIRELPSASDPVAVELSPLFHPSGPFANHDFESSLNSINWHDTAALGSLVSARDYFEAARSWAHRDSFGDLEVAACAYAYVLWQMRYPKTNMALAKAIVTSLVTSQ